VVVGEVKGEIMAVVPVDLRQKLQTALLAGTVAREEEEDYVEKTQR
jgi:hypothetical protein